MPMFCTLLSFWLPSLKPAVFQNLEVITRYMIYTCYLNLYIFSQIDMWLEKGFNVYPSKKWIKVDMTDYQKHR
jgi:hypothetical protein